MPRKIQNESVPEGAPLEREGEVAIQIDDLPHRREENFTLLYANSAGVAANFYDLAIIFGEVNLAIPPAQSYIAEKVAVVMSWEHAKAILASLQATIENYERAKGTIRATPPELRTQP